MKKHPKTRRIDGHVNQRSDDQSAGILDVWHLVRAGFALVAITRSSDRHLVADEVMRRAWFKDTVGMVDDVTEMLKRNGAVDHLQDLLLSSHVGECSFVARGDVSDGDSC